MKKIQVQTTRVTQTANEILGTDAKDLYYLILGEKPAQLIINIGRKTHENVQKILDNTEIQPELKQGGKK